ncbi:T9SS type A sorting domain-containing protein [bacterium]|nr:T9SS type A sorting domain-containing protein [bacterium]
MFRLLLIVLMLAVPTLSHAATITVNAGPIDKDTHWTSDNDYLLNGAVYVTAGHTLTIDPGTVIRAEDGQLESLSFLCISQGAKINAVGTINRPIIFTTKYDTDLASTDDVGPFETGFWGGVLLCGKASTNNANKVQTMEGMPTTWTFTNYGGDDDHDNSGIMKYVSIRHTGIVFAPNKEMQGLTLCGVGDNTVIDYVESYASKDDGVEIFGGTVNMKHFVVAFCEDDCFDTDEGCRAKFQFCFAIQSLGTGNDTLTEQDGGVAPEDAEPWARPQMYNCTFLGTGMNGPETETKIGMHLRDNTAGTWANNIIGDLSGQLLYIETPSSGQGSVDRVADGSLVLKNNIFFNIKAGTTLDAISMKKSGESAYTATMLSNNANAITDPMLANISRQPDGKLDPRPKTGSPAYQNMAVVPNDGFFETVAYKGAFDKDNWMIGWTALDKYGFLKHGGIETVVINAGPIDKDTHWTSDNDYLLNGAVYVTAGHTLTIDPGTVIRAEDGQLESLSFLCISQGAKINAAGTLDHPIIFTTKYDTNLNSTDDVGPFETGFWGGVLLCGKASTNNANKVQTMEGMPTTWTFTNYGGDDDHDNSGVLKYISIRHTGIVFAPNKEMQGLTLCGVGDNTVIDYVESYASKDDGVEIFGGTVNLKHFVVAFCEDDCFDTDEGCRSKFQFCFAIQSEGTGNDTLTEQDGGVAPEDAQPWARPQMYNCTLLGTGMNGPETETKIGMHLRDNTAGTWANNIIGDLSGQLLYIETPSSGQGSVDRVADGSLVMKNNVLFNIKAGSTFEAVSMVKSGEAAYTANMLAQNGNAIADPMLTFITRQPNGAMDPRPATSGSAYQNLAAIPNDGFFETVAYKGAFDKDNWMIGWTALDDYGFLSHAPGTVVAVEENTLPAAIRISQNFPNPFNPSTTINFSLTETSPVKLSVYNVTGQLVDTLIDNSSMVPGTYSVRWDGMGHSSGAYIYRIEAGSTVVTRRMLLVK